MFEELSYNELLNIDAGGGNDWLRIIGQGIFTAGSVMAGGPVPAVFKITNGVFAIMDEF